MKFNFESLEKVYDFSGSSNINHGKRHYNEFFDALIELELSINKRDEFLYRMESFFSGYKNHSHLVISKDGNYMMSRCTCNFHRTYSPCAHIWMLAKYLSENDIKYPYYYKNKNADNKDEFYQNYRNKQILEDKLRESSSIVDKFIKNEIVSNFVKNNETLIELVPFCSEKSGFYKSKFQLKFKIGNEKLYSLRNIEKNLLDALKNEEIVSFGKNLKLEMKLENFSDFAKTLIDFISKNKEELLTDSLSLTKNNIDDFFDICSENYPESFYDVSYIDFSFLDFQISLDIEKIEFEKKTKNKKENKKEENYILFIKNRFTQRESKENFRYYNKIDALTCYYQEKEDFYLTNKRIYKYDFLSESFSYMNLNSYEAKLYENLIDGGVIFSKNKLRDFLLFINEKIENINLSDNIISLLEEYENYLAEVYLDFNEDDNLVIKISYDKEYASLNLKFLVETLITEHSETFISLKDTENFKNKEKNKIDEIFIIDNNKKIDKFLNETLNIIKKYSNVFVSSAIKNMNIAKKVNLSVGVKVVSNLLELNFNSTDLDNGEILDILTQYRKKKKYYRLKNGERIFIDIKQMEFLDNLVKDLNIKDKELKKSKIKVPTHRMYQLDNLPEEFINLEKDKKFDSLFKNKKIEILEKYKNILRDYQINGVEWLLKLRSMKLCGILADDMGLGKTLQIISYLESVKNLKKNKKESDKAVLIITPASLILNWENEFKKFDSALNTLLIYGERKNRIDLIKNIKDEIIITSYDYLKRDIEEYRNLSFDTIILDEAQYIKNHKTKSAKAVKELEAEYKIALTGTPIENTLAEIWSIFDFLMPNYLFNYEYFSNNYEKSIVLNKDNKVSKRLKKMLEPFILRRLKGDVLKELPEKIEETYFIEMNKKEKDLYKANVLSIQEDLAQNFEESNNKIKILAMLTKLRQLCIEPRLVYENIFNVSSKINACMELIKNIIENNQKIILFSSFTSVLDLLKQECEKENISYLLLTGQTSKEKRNDMVNEFQTGDVPIFLISLKAGGTGLNLTKASVVIHIDPWWNISAQNQATDRAYRIGQENKVQVFNLIMKNTIEEKILKLQSEKKNLSDTFVENSSGNFSSLSKDELMNLFKSEF